jgi:ATP:corrinoid adenosyltransferase
MGSRGAWRRGAEVFQDQVVEHVLWPEVLELDFVDAVESKRDRRVLDEVAVAVRKHAVDGEHVHVQFDARPAVRSLAGVAADRHDFGVVKRRPVAKSLD